MAQDSVVLRFDEVTFHYLEQHPIMDEVSFSLRKGSKVALMGQNGAGKTSLFKLILKEQKPVRGGIFLTPPHATVGIAKQVVSIEQRVLTVREFFASTFHDIPYNLDKKIAQVLEAVNLTTDLQKKVGEHSGGEQARLLLAYALIQEPDILLLDEPTNNLDQEGIGHLTGFLVMYEKTAVVISHDADFLNAFTDGVLYLDSHSKKVEQYTGNYSDVVVEITERVEREEMQNARAQRQIQQKIEQAEVFAHKGGKLRLVAKRMRENAQESKESMVEVRKEDKTIRGFTIPVQQFPSDFNGSVLKMTKVSLVDKGRMKEKPIDITLRRGSHLLLAGPNGIGKSTFLQRVVAGEANGVSIGEGVRMGYYRQDFSTFDMNMTAYRCLEEAMGKIDEQFLRSTAAGFLLDGKLLSNQIQYLSEGQKGLLSLARLVLLKPGLLVLDEPTNHINFRHLPIIAEALNQYEGAMMLVSHIPEFVSQIRIDQTIDLGELRSANSI